MFQWAASLFEWPVGVVVAHPFLSFVGLILLIGLFNSGAPASILAGIDDAARWFADKFTDTVEWLSRCINRREMDWLKPITRKEVHPTTDDDITRISWGAVWCIGIILTCFSAAGMLIALTIPVHRVETSERRVVTRKVTENVRREHVVHVPVRGYAPLKDWREGCTNAPAVIKAVLQTGEKDGERKTWFTVQPAGDPFTIACVRDGHYAADFPVGALAVLGAQPDDQSKPPEPEAPSGITMANGAKVAVKDDGVTVTIGDQQGTITSEGTSFGGVAVSQGTTE